LGRKKYVIKVTNDLLRESAFDWSCEQSQYQVALQRPCWT